MQLEDMVMKAVLKDALKSIDTTKHSEQIKKAIDLYCKSNAFLEDFTEGMLEEGIAYELGRAVAKKLTPALKKSIKVTIE